MKIPETTKCSLCGAQATYRMSTPFKHLYRCFMNHTTATDKTPTELQEALDIRPRARQTDPETSHLAAVSMAEGAGAQRERILQELATGPWTADQIDDHIGWRPTTAGRRLSELREMGLVRMLESTGTTRSGRRARLWKRCFDER